MPPYTQIQVVSYLTLLVLTAFLMSGIEIIRQRLTRGGLARLVETEDGLDLSNSRSWLIGGFLIVPIVSAPICEEIVFRLLPLLIWPVNHPAAITWGVGLNIVFAASHSASTPRAYIARVVRCFWWGLLFLSVALISGSIYAAMAVHLATNIWGGRSFLLGRQNEVTYTKEGASPIQINITGWDIPQAVKALALPHLHRGLQ